MAFLNVHSEHSQFTNLALEYSDWLEQILFRHVQIGGWLFAYYFVGVSLCVQNIRYNEWAWLILMAGCANV
jgi:hypothetical protein